MTYNLLFNASLLVEEGFGYAVCFDKIINTTGDSRLCFRPLSPTIEIEMYMIWKNQHNIFKRSLYKHLQMMFSRILYSGILLLSNTSESTLHLLFSEHSALVPDQKLTISCSSFRFLSSIYATKSRYNSCFFRMYVKILRNGAIK